MAGKWAAHFQQMYHGIDVYGGKVHLTYTDQGRLFVAASEYYSGITVNPSPSLTASVAEDIARRALPFNEATDRVEPGSRLYILPVPVSETQVEHHLAWLVTVRTQDPLGKWSTWVDAHSGTILWRHNEICFTNFVGTSGGLNERPSYCEGQTHEPFAYLRIQVSGVGNTYSDASGNWTLAYGGNDAHNVTADLYGTYVDINNSGGAQGTFTGSATPGVPLAVEFTNSNSQKDEKDVYQAVNDIHNYFETFAPGFGYTNTRITANVSLNQTCNAYWDGTINFFKEGGGCANTGEIAGVVYHEFCHGITNAIIGGQGSEGIGEGNSDILSNYMLMESIIGRGFYLNQCSSGIRDSHNTLQYPQDLDGEVHHDGQIIAGFHWDALEVLVGQYGLPEGRRIGVTTWHNGRVLEHPTNQPAQVLATFVADDDNGDLTDGTPHYDAFCTGAHNHSYSCPTIITGVIIGHEPLDSRTQAGDATALSTIRSTEGPLVADSLRLIYRVNGGNFVSVRLNPTGGLNEYRGVIPNLHLYDEVGYYIHARDQLGNTKNDPEDAPASLHEFDIAPTVDLLESPSGWTVNPDGTDNATTGIWVQADPVGTLYGGEQCQPEDDRTATPGVMCWVTGNGNPGDPAGNQDVDGGRTTVQTPTYDLSGAEVAKVKYYRWYTNDLGNNPGQDTWKVQVRNNGGAWTDLENTTSSANAWILHTYDLHALYGAGIGNVQFRFIADDESPNSLIEAAVDNLELLFYGNVGVANADGPARFALQGGRPNPAHQGSTVEFQVPARVPVRLGIYDVSGRLIRVLSDGTFDAGHHSVAWDGMDVVGRPVSSGVYYARMQSPGFNASRPIIIAR